MLIHRLFTQIDIGQVITQVNQQKLWHVALVPAISREGRGKQVSTRGTSSFPAIYGFRVDADALPS